MKLFEIQLWHPGEEPITRFALAFNADAASDIVIRKLNVERNNTYWKRDDLSSVRMLLNGEAVIVSLTDSRAECSLMVMESSRGERSRPA